MPLIRAGVGVTAFFCFMFSWVELLLARTLTITDAKPIAAVMTRTVSASGLDWGLLAAAGMLTIVPGALGHLFRPQLHRQGLRPRPRLKREDRVMDLQWMVWTVPTAIFFAVIAVDAVAMTVWQLVAPSPERRGFLPISTTPGDRLFIGLLVSAYMHLAWIGLTDASLWIVLAISLVWMAVVMRWG